MSMAIASRLCPATDECGKRVYLVEYHSHGTRTMAGAAAETLHLMLGPDHERLCKNGARFFGEHSGKRYTPDA